MITSITVKALFRNRMLIMHAMCNDKSNVGILHCVKNFESGKKVVVSRIVDHW